MGKTTVEKARASRRKHYQKNKEAYIERAKATTKKLQDFVNSKKDKCVSCGEAEKVCLDFHHLRDKVDVINKLVKRGSMKNLEKEIDKCVVLCANCHRKLHAGININTGIAQLVER
jgi:NAD-dependent dihydropyrimidine dehydrogenase PreA subunit